MPLSRRSLLAASPLLLLPAGLSRAAESTSAETFPEFTDRSEKSIRRGTTWLMKTFNRDDGCGIDIGTYSDISCTAIVGLALLAQGNSPIDGPQSHLVRRVVSFLKRAIDENRFTASLNTQVKADLSGYADHHFTAMLLSQVLGQGRDVAATKRALSRVVHVIGESQTPQGHWGQGRYPQLAAVTGWCSLRGAHFAGVKVEGSMDTTAKFLLAQMKSGGGSGSVFNTAAGIRVLYALEMDHEEIARRAFSEAQRASTHYFPRFNQFGGEQYPAFHYINEAMLQAGGQHWRQWFPGVREKLIDVQNADGSWLGHSCIVSRTFCTACALLVLTSPNRYLPISQV